MISPVFADNFITAGHLCNWFFDLQKFLRIRIKLLRNPWGWTSEGRAKWKKKLKCSKLNRKWNRKCLTTKWNKEKFLAQIKIVLIIKGNRFFWSKEIKLFPRRRCSLTRKTILVILFRSIRVQYLKLLWTFLENVVHVFLWYTNLYYIASSKWLFDFYHSVSFKHIKHFKTTFYHLTEKVKLSRFKESKQ